MLKSKEKTFNPKIRKHVIITGTGRAGTTFLIELLTKLGLDTGFNPNNLDIDKIARAGLELDVRDESAPYIIKNPWFIDYAEDVLKREDIRIEHIIIPLRNVSDVAKSRKIVDKTARSQMDILRRLFKKSSTIKGGLWHARSVKKQEIVLQRKLIDFLILISNSFIPITFLNFPRIVNDEEYLYKKLKPIFKEINRDYFKKIFTQTARPNLVHNFNKKQF